MDRWAEVYAPMKLVVEVQKAEEKPSTGTPSSPKAKDGI